MNSNPNDDANDRDLIARLDRIPFWPHSSAVLWVVGIGYLVAFFDITNVSFGLPVFSKTLHFQPGQQAAPITASLIGFVIGSFLNSNVADWVGRKRGIGIATLLFTVGCIGTTFAIGAKSMIAWRFVTGMGIGGEIAVISAYISEMAPASVRGRYTGLANVFAMMGQAVVPVAALGLVPNFSWGWRAMFLLGALGGLTLFWFRQLPESPRWLISKRRVLEAALIIDAAEARARQRSKHYLPAPIETAVEPRADGFPMLALFRAPFAGRVILLFSLWFVWYIGTYAWLGLGPTLFVGHGFTITHSILFMLAGSIGYPLGSLAATAIGDKFERKFSIMIGMSLWSASFVVIGIAGTPVFIYCSVFVLASSLGFFVPLMYALTAESFPTPARATGVGLTEGAGHLGGAVGPMMALTLYGWVSPSSSFRAVFLFMALTGAATLLMLPFAIKATRKSLEVVTRTS